MGDVPTVNTSTWRLPKRSHQTPEASYTDDMYRAKGLPVDPDRAPTTGASGLPIVSTEDWVTPSTRARLEEGRSALDPDDFDEASGCVGAYPKGKGKKGRGRGMGVGKGAGPIGRRAMEGTDEDDFEEACGSSHGSKPKKSYLKKKGPMKESIGDTAVLKKLAQKTGLSKYGPMTGFHSSKIGQYADYMLNPTQGVSVKLHATASGVKWSVGDKVRGDTAKGEVKYGELSKLVPVLKKLVAKHGSREEQVESVQTVQRRLAGLERPRHLEFATGQPYRTMPGESRAVPLQEAAPAPQKRGKSRLPEDQQALAGLSERAPLPHPMGDTRPVGAGRAHGLLDDGMDDGEAFVEQVLQESRWFFRDFGDLALGAKTRPFDEAPGGRAGPWRGSEDEPAETPIVRKGKVKGAVGDEPEEEPEPKDKKQVPPTKRSKAKAPPEEEPEGDEEQEERVEAEGHPGSYLKHGGSKLKALGHHLSHGSAAQRAKAGLHHHLQKFAKKHGIDIHKHFHPYDRPEKMKAPSKKTEAKAPKHIAPTVGPTLKKK